MIKKPRKHFIKCMKCGALIDRSLDKIFQAKSIAAFNPNYGYIYHAMACCPLHVFRVTRMSDPLLLWEILGWSDLGSMITVRHRRDFAHPHWLIPRLHSGEVSKGFQVALPGAGHRCWKFTHVKLWLALYVKKYEKAFYIPGMEWRNKKPGAIIYVNKETLLNGKYDLWNTVLDSWFWRDKALTLRGLKSKGVF